MRIHNILFLMAAAGLVLTSCGKLPDSRLITIEAGIGTMTKVTYITDDAATFASGDTLSLYAWVGSASAVPADRVVDGVVNSFDGTKWTPAFPMLWDDKSSKHYFLGISPARMVTNFTADPYTLDPANFAASDLLIATKLDGLTPISTPVPLIFSHTMARLDVNLEFRNQWESAPTVTSVTATAKTTATVDYLSKTKVVSATGSAASVALTAKNNAAWSGLQVPQEGVHTITIRIDDKDYVFTHSADIPLEGGKYTTVNLIVGRDKIELASVITISNWTAGTTISGGEAQD